MGAYTDLMLRGEWLGLVSSGLTRICRVSEVAPGWVEGGPEVWNGPIMPPLDPFHTCPCVAAPLSSHVGAVPSAVMIIFAPGVSVLME